MNMASAGTEGMNFCDNCKRNISQANYVMHTMHCHKNIKLCNQCQEPVPVSQMDEHFEEYHVKVKCKCGLEIEKGEVEQHEELNCRLRKVECQFCDLEMSMQDFAQHENACGSRTDRCEKCGNYVMLREMTEHVSNGCMNNKKEVKHPNNKPYVSDNPADDFRFASASNGFDRDFIHGYNHNTIGSYGNGVRDGPLNHDSVLSQSMLYNFQGLDPSQEQEDDPAVQELISKTNRVGLRNRYIPDSKKEADDLIARGGAPVFGNGEGISDDELAYASLLQEEMNFFGFRGNQYDDPFLPCEICHDSVPFSLLSLHQESCIMSRDEPVTDSDYGYPRGNQDNYYDEDHDNTLLPCEFCGDLISTGDLIQHQSGCQKELADGVQLKTDNRYLEEKEQYERIADQYEERPRSAERYEDIDHLPCEFCGELFRNEELILHESGCQHNLADVTFPRGTDIVRKPEETAVKKKTDNRVPLGKSKDDLDCIPCEFCSELIPEEKLLIHQPSCPANPQRHLYEDDEMLAEMAVNIDRRDHDRSVSPEEIMDRETMRYFNAINDYPDGASPHAQVIQWLNSIENSGTVETDELLNTNHTHDNEITSSKPLGRKVSEPKQPDLNKSDNGVYRNRPQQSTRDSTNRSANTSNRSVNKTNRLANTTNRSANATRTSSRGIAELNINGKNDDVPHSTRDSSQQSILPSVHKGQREGNSARTKTSSRSRPSRNESARQEKSSASQQSEKSRSHSRSSRNGLGRQESGITPEESEPSQQDRNSLQQTLNELPDEVSNANDENTLVQNSVSNGQRHSARSILRDEATNESDATRNGISESSMNSSEAFPGEEIEERGNSFKTTSRGVQTSAISNHTQRIQQSDIRAGGQRSYNGRTGGQRYYNGRTEGQRSYGTPKRNRSREKVSNFDRQGNGPSLTNSYDSNVSHFNGHQSFRNSGDNLLSSQRPKGQSDVLLSNRPRQQTSRNFAGQIEYNRLPTSNNSNGRRLRPIERNTDSNSGKKAKSRTENNVDLLVKGQTIGLQSGSRTSRESLEQFSRTKRRERKPNDA